MPKIVFRGDDCKKKVVKGIQKAVQIVTTTYGGQGGTVMYNPLHGSGSFTKDGYEVSKNVEFSDLLENVGAKLVKEICDKMAFKVGDGTTTISAVFGALVEEISRHEFAGVFSRDLVEGIQYAIDTALIILDSLATKIHNRDYKSLRSVALVSANGDEGVASYIEEAYRSINEQGDYGNPVILIEESKTERSSIQIVKGMQLYRGIFTRQFFKNNEKNTLKIELLQPFVLIIAKTVARNDIQQLLPVLDQFVKQGKSFVVFAHDFTEDVINFFTTNRHHGVSDGICVKTPGFGDGQLAISQDIAIRTGGKVLCENSNTLDTENMSTNIGTAEKICIDIDTTVIVDGKGNENDINQRYAFLQEEYKKAISNYQKEQLENRISSLIGVVCMIRVGGVSDMIVKETKDRVDDANHATKNALLYGIVPGGNIDLICVVHQIEKMLESSALTKNQRRGIEILACVLRQPFYMLVHSCSLSGGVSENLVLEKYKLSGKLEYGIDVRTGKLENFIEKGILNPAAVSVNVLKILREIITVFVSCKVFVVDTPSEEKGLKEGFNPI